MSETPLVVANPQAGGGRAAGMIDEVRRVLERRVGPVDLARTTARGDAIAIARRAAEEGRQRLIVLGGDGTFHEAANGVLAVPNAVTALGFVGLGTGGDFRRTLGLEHRLDRYVEAIARNVPRAVDAARVTYDDGRGGTCARTFVNVASAGLGGLVDRHVERTPRAFGSAAAYALASVRALAEAAPARLLCTFDLEDGTTTTRALDAYVVAVCNGRTFGAGMHVAPMARIDDGLLDVITMMAPSKAAFAWAARRIYDGEHLGHEGTTHTRCRAASFAVERPCTSPFLLDVDGEALGQLPARVEVLPRALRVLV